MLLLLLLLLLWGGACDAAFNVSNTLGDGMVLQRAPKSAVVFGLGTPGETITTTFNSHSLSTSIGADGVWRQALPPTAAAKAPTTITFLGSGGGKAELKDVLFGDVFLCGGQSNMQYTPRSMAGMNNMSAELAAADGFGDSIRLFTAGMESVCGTPGSASGRALPRADCTKPWRELNPNISVSNWTQDGSEAQYINGTWMNETCGKGHACRQPWARASSATLGAQSWNTFSAVCWLFGRDIHDALGGEVPVGLISSNWGGTPVESWLPETAAKSCSRNAQGGSLYNTMIAPFTVGPMALNGFIWYQGESNIGSGSDRGKNAHSYSCNFPAMVTGWRTAFNDSALFFGFVQVAGFGYAGTVNCSDGTAHACPDTAHSLAAGDLRQAQLAALKLPNVGFSTTVDTGDYTNIHPPDKQTPSHRLANQALRIIYKQEAAEFPFYASQSLAVSQHSGATTLTVIVAIRTGQPGSSRAKVQLTTTAPPAATQSTTLGAGVLLPRNKCVTSGADFGHGLKTFPEFCGYPMIYGTAANGTTLSLNASATIGSDGSSIVLSVVAPSGGLNVTGTSYGRATWPMTVFFSEAGLPVIPWFASLSTTDPWTSPGWIGPEQQAQRQLWEGGDRSNGNVPAETLLMPDSYEASTSSDI